MAAPVPAAMRASLDLEAAKVGRPELGDLRAAICVGGHCRNLS